MLNLHRLFYSSAFTDSYHGVLLPTERQKQYLTRAKDKIRDDLREGIEAASLSVLGQAKRVSPRFRTQGSWSYNLCNQPAHMPPQEIDWDLGVYLPISVWEDSRPKVAAVAYFRLVEGLLASLCKKERWTLVTKDTCVRVVIGDGCHVDVPLYAAPEAQFAAVQERVLAKSMALREAAEFAEARAHGEMVERDWDSLKEIVLATRDGEWRPSDPGVVSDWYRHQAAEHGEQVDRMCRYMKGWRDHQWLEGGPSSVALMICVCQTMTVIKGRDDLALLEITRHLGDKLSNDVHEELIDPREQFNKLSPQERIDAARRANELHQALKGGLEGQKWQKEDVLQALRAQFGPRLPDQPDWLTDDTPQNVVRTTPAFIVPQPVVKRTRAG